LLLRVALGLLGFALHDNFSRVRDYADGMLPQFWSL
jgi:hypothetical protein